MYGVKDSEINTKIDEGLKLVDLTDKQNIRMRKYSGGMRRRLELARGFLHSPKILFLDEPTLGLDPQTRENLWVYIKKLSTENKITIILTTHYMEEADMLCDRVAIIDHGKVVALDTPLNFKKSLGGDLVTVKTKNPELSELEKMDCVLRMQYKDNLFESHGERRQYALAENFGACRRSGRRRTPFADVKRRLLKIDRQTDAG